MKKAFISVYVLLILLILSLSISFIYKENESNYENSLDLYNKKVAMFEAESLLNMTLEEIRVDKENWIDLEKGKIKTESINNLANNFDKKLDFSIGDYEKEVDIKIGENERVLSIQSKYKGTISYAIMVYKLDEKGNLKIVYNRVY